MNKEEFAKRDSEIITQIRKLEEIRYDIDTEYKKQFENKFFTPNENSGVVKKSIFKTLLLSRYSTSRPELCYVRCFLCENESGHWYKIDEELCWAEWCVDDIDTAKEISKNEYCKIRKEIIQIIKDKETKELDNKFNELVSDAPLGADE